MRSVTTSLVRKFFDSVKHDYPEATGAIQDVLDSPESLDRLTGILDRVLNGPTLHSIAAMNATIDVDRVSSLDMARDLLVRIRDEARSALAFSKVDPLREAVAQAILHASQPNDVYMGAVMVHVPLTLMRKLQDRLGADEEMDTQSILTAGAKAWKPVDRTGRGVQL